MLPNTFVSAILLILLYCACEVVRSIELGCYEPICNQGTAYFGHIFGHAGIELFIDAYDQLDILEICVRITSTGNKLDDYLGSEDHCTSNTKSGHFHFPMLLGPGHEVTPTLDIARESFFDAISRFVYRNGTMSIDVKRTYFVLCITNYDGINPVSSVGTVFWRTPQYGSLHANAFDAKYLASEPIRTKSEGLQFIVDGVHSATIDPFNTSIYATGDDGNSQSDDADKTVKNQDSEGGMEPASWFFSLTPMLTPAASQGGIVGLPTIGYVEYVLTPPQLLRQRIFANLQELSVSTAEKRVDNPAVSKKINVCIWASVEPDGQKRIYLDQMQDLSSDFQFTYFLSSESPLTSEDIKRPLNDIEEKLRVLSQNNDPSRPLVFVVQSPMSGNNINMKDLAEHPTDGSQIIDQNSSGDDVLRYLAKRFDAAGGNIDNITPSWSRNPYVIIRDAFRSHKCDISVHGNNRAFSADFLISSAARSVGIPSVAELLNLYVGGDGLPDVLVGPSEYSIQHNSVSWLRNLRHKNGTCVHKPSNISAEQAPIGLDFHRHECGPATAVVAPAVDINFFQPDRIYKDPPVLFADSSACPIDGCPLIGFMARLATEKNPGLFLLAAHSILSSHPSARFVIIGGGHLREHLQTLAARLKISSRVAFTGWVSHDSLPSILSTIDVMVNPSVRGWSETFCIANIESMAMRVPLVTFATGGVGQYVRSPLKNSDMQSELFSIGENAILVNEASPQALALGIACLLDDGELRKRIGEAGRITVTNHFRSEQQMWRYEQLYRYLNGTRV